MEYEDLSMEERAFFNLKLEHSFKIRDGAKTGKGGRNFFRKIDILNEIKRVYKFYGRFPTTSELKTCSPSQTTIEYRFGSMENAYVEAGLMDIEEAMHIVEKRVLKAIKKDRKQNKNRFADFLDFVEGFVEEHGRFPMSYEMKKEQWVFYHLFGSDRDKVLEFIGYRIVDKNCKENNMFVAPVSA